MIGNPFQFADWVCAKAFIFDLANLDIWKFSLNCFELVQVSFPFDAREGNKRTSMPLPFLSIMLGHLAAPYVQALPSFPKWCVQAGVSNGATIASDVNKLGVRENSVQKTDARQPSYLNE